MRQLTLPQFATHLPIALPFAFNADTVNQTYFPSLGATLLQAWGTTGSDASSVTVGTLEEIIDDLANSNGNVPSRMSCPCCGLNSVAYSMEADISDV